MKHLSFPALALVLIALFSASTSYAQSNEWTWMSGSNVIGSNCHAGDCGQPGIYGTMGQVASGNTPGGRYSGYQWTDMDGNLWLYGGWGFDLNGDAGILNDLWEYNISTHQWAWMNGSSVLTSTCASNVRCVPANYGNLGQSSKSNTPGSRASGFAWTDNNGNLWLFGGTGYFTNTQNNNTVFVNDLWMYSPSTQEWTWIGGSNSGGVEGIYGIPTIPNPGNLPGARAAGQSWTDKNGILWLFGGEGLDSANCFGFLNDLWSFNPTTQEWTWMNGQSTFTNCSQPFAPGVYGNLGQFEAGNVPGGRVYTECWSDADGNFWLYGGVSFLSGTQENPDDLWEYKPSLNEWAWINGNDTLGPDSGNSWPQINSSAGNFSSNNTPGTRVNAVAQFNNDGKALVFSGGADNYIGCDLWAYDPTSNEWAWLSGPFVQCDGQFGTQGQASANNYPSYRFDAYSWSDKKGNLWLFGGVGLDSLSNFGALNDLWVYAQLLTTPTISWSPASPIVYPTPLSSAQFNTSAMNGSTNISTDGTFIYYVGPVSGGVIATTSTILPIGTDQLCVQWTPDSSHASTYNAASGCANVQVISNSGPTPTTISISSNQNPVFVSNPITFTAAVTSASGTPSGTVNFYDSNTIIGSQTLSNGQATFTTSSLTVGAHTIAARFVANPNFSGSTSGYVSEYVDDFSLVNNSPSLIVIPPVSSGSMTFTVSPFGPSLTIPQNITATVTGIPSGVQYSFNPSTISAGQTTTALSLNIASPIQASLHRDSLSRTTAPFLLSLLLLPFTAIFRRANKKFTNFTLLVLLTLIGAMSLSSCGSVLKTSTNIVTVTATSGSLSHTVSFQLTLE